MTLAAIAESEADNINHSKSLIDHLNMTNSRLY